jgi:hypothetical protein
LAIGCCQKEEKLKELLGFALLAAANKEINPSNYLVLGYWPQTTKRTTQVITGFWGLLAADKKKKNSSSYL